MPEITLAIPNLNGGKFLAQTLASLVGQETPVRWHLQDCCSADNSIEVAKAFFRPGDAIIIERDGGQAHALNMALSRMGGDIIGFLNSDDRLFPGAATHILELFEDPHADLVVGGVRYMDENGAPVRDHFGRINSLEEMLNLFDVWFQERQWVQPEVFMRRSLWNKVGAFNASYNYAFDYDYWVRCLRAGARVRTTDRLLAEFRLHAAQKSTNSAAAGRELFRIARGHVRSSREISPHFRRTMSARLDYSMNQARMSRDQSIPSQFAKDLAKNPSWLLGRECRHRILQSFRHRLGRKLQPAASL